MKRRAVYWIVPLSILAALGLWLAVTWPRVAVDFEAAVTADRPARIRPDYTDTVLPPNIAPPNFVVEEPGAAYGVRIRAAEGEAIHVASRSPRITIPPSRWRRLLRANRGRKLYFDVCVHSSGGPWTRFEPIQNVIADADVDRYLFYRLMKPIYIVRLNLAIHQRDLETYEESVVLSNRSFRGGCINCHCFAPGHPDQLIVHSRGGDRGSEWSGMTVVRQGRIIKVDTRALVRTPESDRGRVTQSQAGYTAWHPNGRLAAFSANKISQFFHSAGENRDVFDSESDLALYHADSNTVTTTPAISQPGRLETFPTWSPDGRYLYFSSADPMPMERYKEVRYDLMRIRYEAAAGRWGEVEPVLLAKETGLSMTEPRVSPDGRWVLFCMSAYGAFPAYRPSSDLYLLDLETRQYHRLAANSPRCESWHCWSRNSRWIAFASKRRDGVFARIYFSYIDEEGRAHKPVLLPQRDPMFYDRLLKTYNVPELADAPAPAMGRALAQVIRCRDFAGGVKLDAASGTLETDVP